MSITSKKVRMMFAAGDTIRDAGLKTPEDIERFDDICYGTDKKWQMLDVYRPKEAAGEMLPVLVNFHGGGWVYGDKERYQFYCMSLAQQGFAVVNFTYRLAPEFRFPAPVEDANLVLRWVLEHTEQYGFDINRICATGDSAGATLLTQYTTMSTNPKYAALFPFKIPQNLKIRAILLNCGQYELVLGDSADELTTALMQDYLPNGGDDEELNQMNALPYMTETYPPTYLMTANRDFLQTQAPIMQQKLEKLGIPHAFQMYGDEKHPLQHVFHCNIKLEEAKKCNTEECNFLKQCITNIE